jgi:multicomponent Na+:H+ antiporter subunit C
MEIFVALIIGFLYGASVYMFLRRSIVKLVLGIIFLSHATNLLLFATGGFIQGAPPFVAQEAEAVSGSMADPLPQALVLTALVISLGVTAFSLVLIYRFYKETGSVDLDELSELEKK